MKLVNSKVELIEQKPGSQGILEMIETGARTCYKSEGLTRYDDLGNSITAPSFVDKIVNIYKHQSVAEHGTVYMRIPNDVWIANSLLSVRCWTRDLMVNPYTQYVSDGQYFYVTTNYRVILNNQSLLEPYSLYLCKEPYDLHERRISVRWICSRSTSHQLVRHRSLSFSQESMRFCNYSKDKFSRQITYIIPSWAEKELKEGEIDELSTNLVYKDGTKIKISDTTFKFLKSLQNSEEDYMTLTEHSSLKAEEARDVLPGATKTELIVTGFFSDWIKFFSLRCDTHAQEDIRKLSNNFLNITKNEMPFLWE